jgi:hypothetical protein
LPANSFRSRENRFPEGKPAALSENNRAFQGDRSPGGDQASTELWTRTTGSQKETLRYRCHAENYRFFRGNLLKIGLNPLVFGLFYAILAVPMAIQKKNAFSRRLPDLVTEELVTVLSQKKSFEFKQLFAIVHENLRQRNAASGGEEMLRLRAYEKLQNLVARGVVKKNGKIYKGDSGALAAMAAANAAQAAAIASK